MAVTAKFQADFSSFQQAVQKAELSLKSFETGAGKVEKSLGRMGDSFSGVKIIQEANLLARAIGGVEGATKLTEAEQRKANATLTEAIAKYKALGMEAPAHLRALAQATAEVQQKTSLADKAAGLLKSSFGQFTAANLAASAISTVTAKVTEFASKGTQLRGLESSFSNLSAGIKQDSGAMLSTLQTNTRGLVANFDLLASANKAMLLGIPVTTDSMGEMAKAATMLGRAMGQDATKSLDDLITALGRSSPLILDNLGLTVKVGEANEAYAKKMGISVDAMDEAQKKLAFYEAAMEAARKKTKELGEETLTLSERIGSVWVTVENNVTKIVSNMNVVLGKATESWKDFFKFLGDSAQFKSWDEMAKRLEKPIVKSLPFIDPTALARPSKIYQEEMAAVDKAFEESKRKMVEAAKKAEQDIKNNEAASVKLRADLVVQSYEETRMALKHYYDMIRQANDAVEEGLDGIKLRKSTEVSVLNGLVGQWLKYREAIESVNSKIKIGLESAPGSHLGPEGLLSGPAGKWVDSLGKMEKSARRAREETLGLVDAIGRLGYDIGGSFGESISNIAQGWIEAAMAADQYANATTKAGKAMAVVQGASAVWHATGGQSRGGAVAGGALAGAQAGMAFGPYGAAVGAAAGAIVGLVRSANQGRKAVEEFAKSFGGFDALQARLQTLPKYADTFWRALTQGGGDTKKVMEQINQAFALQQDIMGQSVPTLAEVTAAAERYGLEVDKIGDGINDLRVTETANQAIADWELMAKAGANMNDVAAGMADEIQALIIESMKWGHALPDTMKPIVEKMRDLGLLTDDAGEKLEDLDAIKWQKPMQQAIDDLIAKLDELINKIGGVGGALNGLPRGVDVGIDAREGRGPIDEVAGENSFAGGTGGFMNFGRGRWAKLHGWEAVIRPQDVAPAKNASSDNTSLALVVNLLRSIDRRLDLMPRATRDAVLLGPA